MVSELGSFGNCNINAVTQVVGKTSIKGLEFETYGGLMSTMMTYLWIKRPILIILTLLMIIVVVNRKRILFIPPFIIMTIHICSNVTFCFLLTEVLGYHVLLMWTTTCLEILIYFIVYAEWTAMYLKQKIRLRYEAKNRSTNGEIRPKLSKLF